MKPSGGSPGGVPWGASANTPAAESISDIVSRMDNSFFILLISCLSIIFLVAGIIPGSIIMHANLKISLNVFTMNMALYDIIPDGYSPHY